MADKTDSRVVDYRTCFSTDAGKRVLGNLLSYGGYFDTNLNTAGDIAVQNFVKQIVLNLGIFSMDGETIEGIDSYVNGLFNLPSRI